MLKVWVLSLPCVRLTGPEIVMLQKAKISLFPLHHPSWGVGGGRHSWWQLHHLLSPQQCVLVGAAASYGS